MIEDRNKITVEGRRRIALCLASLFLGLHPAGAAAQMGGAAPAGPAVKGPSGPSRPPTTDPERPPELCRESVSEDWQRPSIEEEFPSRGTSGHVAWLILTIQHLPGEQVMPGGLEFPPEASERELLAAAEFELPHPHSDVKASLERTDQGKTAITKLRLPIIPLPQDAGRHRLTLPPLPLAIARASGQVQTVCTSSHSITVEDPLASSPKKEPSPDPAPRPQREIWWTARDVVAALLVALPIAALVAYLFYRFFDRFKKTPKPPPPRPAWEVAMEQLDALEAEGLLERKDYELYLDRASDTLREYLGARYGFEGLESTTREILRQLEQKAPHFPFTSSVRTLLQRTDLVKFARRLPDEQECKDAVREVRRIVQQTSLAEDSENHGRHTDQTQPASPTNSQRQEQKKQQDDKPQGEQTEQEKQQREEKR